MLRNDENMDYTVFEVCPNCDREIGVVWDTKTEGLKLFCPACGERLMLCSMCEGNCDYDTTTDSCKHNPPAVQRILQGE